MTDIESPLGRKSFASAQNRVLTVDDPTEAQPERRAIRELTDEEMAELARIRTESKRTQNVVSQNARERIEFLAGIGRIQTDFKMDGVTFHLQSLKSGELEDVLDTMMSSGIKNDAKFNFELRRHTLARSLVSIDNMAIQDILGSDNIADKLNLLKSLDENLIDYMYKHYEEHILKVSKTKYAIKTDEDVKEVVETVKKS
jgi:hypothetical protein